MRSGGAGRSDPSRPADPPRTVAAHELVTLRAASGPARLRLRRRARPSRLRRARIVSRSQPQIAHRHVAAAGVAAARASVRALRRQRSRFLAHSGEQVTDLKWIAGSPRRSRAAAAAAQEQRQVAQRHPSGPGSTARSTPARGGRTGAGARGRSRSPAPAGTRGCTSSGSPEDEREAPASAPLDHRLGVAAARGAAPLIAAGRGERAAGASGLVEAALVAARGALGGARHGAAPERAEAAALAELLGRGAGATALGAAPCGGHRRMLPRTRGYTPRGSGATVDRSGAHGSVVSKRAVTRCANRAFDRSIH
jgi:hypothetical protein